MARDNVTEGEAIACGAIAAKLKEWGLPLALRPPYTQVSAGSHVSCSIGGDSAARCWGALDFGEQYLTNQRLALPGMRWRSVSVGVRNLCSIDDAGAA